MPPKKRKAAATTSRTKTQSKATVKLGIAIVALAAAGGLAFAAAPGGKDSFKKSFAFAPSSVTNYTTSSKAKKKNSFKDKLFAQKKQQEKLQPSYLNDEGQKCGMNSYSVGSKCNGGYLGASVICHDGEEMAVGNEDFCSSSADLYNKAIALCHGRCVPAPEPAHCQETGCDPGFECQIGGQQDGECIAAPDPAILRVATSTVDMPDIKLIQEGQEIILGAWTLEAMNRDIEISNLFFANNSDPDGSNTPEGDIDERLFRVDMRSEGDDGRVWMGGVAMQNGRLHYRLGINPVIRAGETYTITLRGEMLPFEIGNGAGTALRMALYGVDARESFGGEDLGNDQIETGWPSNDWRVDWDWRAGEGVLSGDDARFLDALTRRASSMHFYRAVPAFQQLQLPTNVLANGTNTLGAIRVTATGNDVYLKAFSTSISGRCSGVLIFDSCLDPDTLRVYDTTLGEYNELDADVVIGRRGRVQFVLSNTLIISDRQPRDLMIEGDVIGARNGDVIQTNFSINEGTPGPHTAPELLNGSPYENSVIWSDNALGQGSLERAHWMNGDGLGFYGNYIGLMFQN